MNSRSNILREIKRIVLEKEPTAKIFLFGSRAKASEGKDSDWDLLILLDREKISQEIEISITYPIYDLEFDTGEIMNPLVYSEQEWNTRYSITPFYMNVMKESKRL
jgi:uncharacterized protein